MTRSPRPRSWRLAHGRFRAPHARQRRGTEDPRRCAGRRCPTSSRLTLAVGRLAHAGWEIELDELVPRQHGVGSWARRARPGADPATSVTTVVATTRWTAMQPEAPCPARHVRRGDDVADHDATPSGRSSVLAVVHQAAGTGSGSSSVPGLRGRSRSPSTAADAAAGRRCERQVPERVRPTVPAWLVGHRSTGSDDNPCWQPPVTGRPRGTAIPETPVLTVGLSLGAESSSCPSPLQTPSAEPRPPCPRRGPGWRSPHRRAVMTASAAPVRREHAPFPGTALRLSCAVRSCFSLVLSGLMGGGQGSAVRAGRAGPTARSRFTGNRTSARGRHWSGGRWYRDQPRPFRLRAMTWHELVPGERRVSGPARPVACASYWRACDRGADHVAVHDR